MAGPKDVLEAGCHQRNEKYHFGPVTAQAPNAIVRQLEHITPSRQRAKAEQFSPKTADQCRDSGGLIPVAFVAGACNRGADGGAYPRLHRLLEECRLPSRAAHAAEHLLAGAPTVCPGIWQRSGTIVMGTRSCPIHSSGSPGTDGDNGRCRSLPRPDPAHSPATAARPRSDVPPRPAGPAAYARRPFNLLACHAR